MIPKDPERSEDEKEVDLHGSNLEMLQTALPFENLKHKACPPKHLPPLNESNGHAVASHRMSLSNSQERNSNEDEEEDKSGLMEELKVPIQDQEDSYADPSAIEDSSGDEDSSAKCSNNDDDEDKVEESLSESDDDNPDANNGALANLIYRRVGADIRKAGQQKSSFEKNKLIVVDFSKRPEESDADDVYPLSIEYNAKKAWINLICRYLLLIVIIALTTQLTILFSPADFEIEPRLNYFANVLTKETLSISPDQEFEFHIKNWKIYVLENLDTTDSIILSVDANEAASVDVSKSGDKVVATVDSELNAPKCFVEIQVPGGVNINKLSFEFDGGALENLVIADYKDESDWITPMTLNTLEIVIKDTYPAVKFLHEHEVQNLIVKGSYCACTFERLKVKSMDYDVSVGSLNVIQHSMYSENKVDITTPFGTYCAAGATVNADTSADWPSETLRSTGFVSTEVDTSTVCVAKMFICSDSSTNWPAAGTAASNTQGEFTIVQDDGPVQFLIDDSTTTTSSTFNPYYDTFSVTAQATLNDDKEDFESVEDAPRIYLYEVVSPGYERLWVHSSLRQYIEARPWLLSVLSFSVLKPTLYRQTLLHIPSATCPNPGPTNVKQNTFISEKLYELSFTESWHLMAIKVNSSYYEYIITEQGDLKQVEIPMVTGNIALLLCVVFTCLLAFSSIIMAFILLIRFKIILERKMSENINKSRKIANTKKEIKKQDKEEKKQGPTNEKKVTKTLKVSLFSSRVSKRKVIIKGEEKEKKEKEKAAKKAKNNKVRISFFKIPEIYFDHQRRKKAKSFKEFLDRVTESAKHFPRWKMESADGWKTTSVKLDIVDEKYREFCTREGYEPKNIEKQKDTLKKYQLKIIYKMDESTQAYTNLKWKTEEEKEEAVQAIATEGEKGDNANNSVLDFLNAECAVSSFASDYILVPELKAKYDEYCARKKIDKLVKIGIVGSIEIEEFGALFNQNMMIPYLSGLATARIKHKDKGLIQNLVRIPKEQGGNLKTVRPTNVNGGLKPLISGRMGLWTNFRLVLAQYIMLFIVPMPIFFAWVWSLQEVNLIDEDIYASTYSIEDIFFASKTDFWYDDLSMPYLFLAIAGLTGLFLVSGCIELISYYATAEKDTGKYEVKYSIAKRVSIIIFWILLTIYIALYSAYISVILAWCILGAIINPQKFLPIATGAGVFVIFVALMLSKLKGVHKSLEEAVSKGVDEGLMKVIEKATGGKADKLVAGLKSGFKDMTTKAFHTALSMFLSKNSFSPISMKSSAAILQGDLNELIGLLHEWCGIDENVALGLLGLLKGDNAILIEWIGNVAQEIGSNADLAVIMGEIILDKYNPNDSGVNGVNGKTILTIKKLFKKVFPTFPMEAIEMVLQIILEKDPRPLKDLMEDLNIPIILYDISEALATRNEDKIHNMLRPFAYEILPEPYPRIFDALYSIYKGDIIENLDSLATLIDFKPKFMLTMIVAMLKGDDDSTQHAIRESVYGICELANKRGVESRSIEQWIDSILALHVLNKKVDVDILKYIEEYKINVNIKMVTTFYEACSKAHAHEIGEILDEMGIINKDIIIEFCNLCLERDTKVSALAEKLGVYPEDTSKLFAAFKFTISVMSLYSNQGLQKFPSLEDRIFSTMVDKNTENDLKESIRLLYTTSLISLSETGDKLEKVINKKVDKMHKTIMKMKQNVIDDTLTVPLQELGIDFDEFLSFKSLCTMIVFFIDSVPFKKIQTSDSLELASKMAIDLLDLYDEDQLEFIMDMISCNPYRIFGLETATPVINLAEKDIKGKFKQHRLIFLSEILESPKESIKELSVFWINAHQNVMRGEQSLVQLAKHSLAINPVFIDLIFKSQSNNLETSREFSIEERQKLSIRFMKDELWRLEKIKSIKQKHVKHKNRRGQELEEDGESYLESTHKCGEEEFLNCVMHSILFIPSESNDSSKGKRSRIDKKEVKEFIETCHHMLDISIGDPRVYKRLLAVPMKTAELIGYVIKAIDNHDFESFIDLITKLTSFINTNVSKLSIKSISSKANKYSKAKGKNTGDITKKSTLNQRLLIQVMLFFTMKKMHAFWLAMKYKNVESEAKLKEIIEKFNGFLPESKHLIPNHMCWDNLMASLFDSGFFNELALILFTKNGKIDKKLGDPRAIMGIIVGFCLENNELIQNSIITLNKDVVKKDILNGMIGFISKDFSYETSIKNLCKKIKINGTLTVNLMKFAIDRQDSDKFNAAKAIWRGFCSAPKKAAALAAIVKGDLSGASLLCQKLGIEPEFMSILLAIACRRFDLLDNKYLTIANKLGIHNTKAVETMLKVLSGDVDMVRELLLNQNVIFEAIDPQLLECILTLIVKANSKIRPSDMQEFLTEPEYQILCETFCFYLMKRYGIITEKCVEEEPMESIEDAQIKPAESTLSNKIQILISACLGGHAALDELKDLFVEHKAKVDPIFTNHPRKAKMIIQQKLQAVYYGADTELRELDAQFDNNIQKYSKYIKYLENFDIGSVLTVEELISREDYSKYREEIDKLETDDLKVAFVLGCTFSSGRFIPFYQKYYFCITWADSNPNEDRVVICMTCKLFCHAGHNTVVANEGSRGLIVWSWGAGTFPYIDDEQAESKICNVRCTMLHEERKNNIIIENLNSSNEDDEFRNKKVQGDPEKDNMLLNLPGGLKPAQQDDDVQSMIMNSSQRCSSIGSKQHKNSKAPKQYQDEFVGYSNSQFIGDLARIFKFKEVEVRDGWKSIVDHKFKIFDESLNREVHLLEHVILLANGCCRHGLLKILANTEPLDDKLERMAIPYWSGYSLAYDTLATFVAAYQNNIRMFTRYNEILLNAVNLKSTKGYHFKDKGKDLYLLIKGDPIFKDKDKYTDSFARYTEIFTKAFGKEYMKALCLHKFALLNENEVVELINIEDAPIKQTKKNSASLVPDRNDLLKCMHELLIGQFLGTDLQCGEDATKWIETFIQVSLGDLEGYKFICKQYEILNSKAMIFKSICSEDHEEMLPLFKACKGLIDDDICFQLSSILNEKVLKLGYGEGCNAQVVHRVESIQSFFENKNRTVEVFQEIFANAKIDKDIANIIYGFTALLNKDNENVVNIFKHKKHKHEELELFKHIIRLATSSNISDEAFKESFQSVLERILQRSTKAKSKDVAKRIEDLSDSNGMIVLQHLLKAANGNVFSLANFANYTCFHNKSNILSVLASLATDTPFAQNVEDGNFDALRKEMKKFLIYQFNFLNKVGQGQDDSFVKNLFEEYNLDYYILRLLFKPNMSLEGLLAEIETQSNWKDKRLFEIVKIISEIATNSNKIPDLSDFFKYIIESTSIVGEGKWNQDDPYNFVIKNRISQPDEISKNINVSFMNLQNKVADSQEGELIDFKSYEEKHGEQFKYKVFENSISINVPAFFKAILEAGYGKEESAITIIELLAPIFRKVPCAVDLIELCLQIVRGDRDKLMKKSADLIKFAIIRTVHKITSKSKSKVIPSQNELDKMMKSYNLSIEMIECIVSCIQTCIFMLNKNALDVDFAEYKAICYKFWNALEDYQDQMQSKMEKKNSNKNKLKEDLIGDVDRLTDMMMFIIGVCKGDFNLIDSVAQKLGSFDIGKVKKLVNILNTHADMIFSGNFKGIPSMANLKQQASDAAKNAEELANKAADALNNAGASIEKEAGKSEISTLVSNTTDSGSSDMIVGIMFKKFDQDDSGYIDFQEFSELCKFLGLKLDKEKLLELFAQADETCNNQINPGEFKNALMLLKKEVCRETLKRLGMSMEDLIWIGVVAIVFLLQLFVLIFLGISAFSQTNDFNSVINSIFPLVAGVLSGNKKINLGQLTKVKSYVQQVLAKIND